MVEGTATLTSPLDIPHQVLSFNLTRLLDNELAGIGEYWIVDPFQRAVEIYRLVDGVYRDPEIVSGGTISPRVFPGLENEIVKIWPT